MRDDFSIHRKVQNHSFNYLGYFTIAAASSVMSGRNQTDPAEMHSITWFAKITASYSCHRVNLTSRCSIRTSKSSNVSWDSSLPEDLQEP